MSRRELRALHCESATSETLGLRSGKRRAMLQDTDASIEVTRELRGEVDELKPNLTVRENELRALEEEIRTLNADFTNESMKMELESLRNLETIRKQHEQTLRRERDAVDRDRQERKEDCERWEEEKRTFLEKVNSLEKENTKLRSRRKKGKQGTDNPVPTTLCRQPCADNPVPITLCRFRNLPTTTPCRLRPRADYWINRRPRADHWISRRRPSDASRNCQRGQRVACVEVSIAVPTPGSESPGSVSPLSEGGGERFGVGVETRSSSRNSGSLVGMETRSNSRNSGSLVGMETRSNSRNSGSLVGMETRSNSRNSGSLVGMLSEN